jgi:peptidoglycan/LPS O-acetylase OafA/YrhL
LQKLAVSAIVLVWLCANERRLPRWLDTVATTAFSIYFLHAFVLLLLEKIQAYAGLASSQVTAIIFAGFLCLIATVWICVLLSLLARQVLGRRSRLLIGA